MILKLLVPALALAALAGCAAYVPEPDARMAGGDEGRLADLRAGRRLYVDKCAGCHSLIPVDRFDASRWKEEVLEMQRLKKVRLGADEQSRLLLYLAAAGDRAR